MSGELTYGTAGSENAVVRDLASQALGVVADEGAARVVIVPDGGKAEVVDLERHSLSPWRPRGTARPKSVESFIDYVKRHADARTTVWVEPDSGKVVAVLNDIGAEQSPEWGDLRAELVLPVTPEWEHWASRDGTYGTQREFAEHLEEGIDEIREPSAAELLEVAQTMQATVTAEFRSASRLHDGTIVAQWAETVDARAGQAGDLTIPQQITLGIAPFYGEQPYAITARVRYRIAQGELRIGYKLDRPDVVVRDCLTSIRDRIKEEFASVYIGTPASPVGDRR